MVIIQGESLLRLASIAVQSDHDDYILDIRSESILVGRLIYAVFILFYASQAPTCMQWRSVLRTRPCSPLFVAIKLYSQARSQPVFSGKPRFTG